MVKYFLTKAIDNDTKAEAIWISNLQVNDSNNTVTGTVAINRNLTSRSATITLTTGSNPNLSLATPYSFTLVQSALTPTNITWKVKWNGFSDSYSWGAFNGTPSGSSFKYFITNIDTLFGVPFAIECPLGGNAIKLRSILRLL